MRRTSLLRSTLLVCSTFTLASCVTDGTEADGDDALDDVATSTVEQGVSWTALNWYPCTATECSWSIGNPATSTCFLAGVTGDLAAGTAAYPAGVNIVNNGTYWGLYIKNPSYGDVSAMVTCIGNTANRVQASWSTNDAATLIPAGTSARRCFLSGIYSYASTGFHNFESNAYIWRDGNDHFIGGNMPAGSNDRIFATCVDVPTNQGSYAYGNGTNSTVTGNLTYNPASGGVACGLTGIGGIFNTSDNSKGVWIDYNSATRYWNWTLTPWTGAWSLCVK